MLPTRRSSFQTVKSTLFSVVSFFNSGRQMKQTRALVTGADGFLGKNLCARLTELGFHVLKYTRSTGSHNLDELLGGVDVVFHLAGANRPLRDSEFEDDNQNFTQILCDKLASNLKKNPRNVPIVFSSSVSALEETPYGLSKKLTENIIENFSQGNRAKARILRLPNIFGKGCRPNYNSVVATFCSKAMLDEPLQINDETKLLRLLYVEDLIDQMLDSFMSCEAGSPDLIKSELDGYHEISVGDLAKIILKFEANRKLGIFDNVGSSFERKLFSTYISYLPTKNFVHHIDAKIDSRGSFAEFIKSTDAGQVSVLRCSPGEIRGRHYHNTKSEQFLVIQGKMKVRFENIYSGEILERVVIGDNFEVVWAIPGWAHSFENIGHIDSLAIVWANEIFDSKAPDTYTYPKEV